MKTIALKERTFVLLNELKRRAKKDSFDELVLELVIKKEGVADSMFGSLRGKTKAFTQKERKELWTDEYR
jgi:predicted CopG family antitoxin